ncbi:hypothetical protein HWV62_17488 [Athelia sp. TMB]|nr:hypothetical protein HWV62_17488 [Athelia sp. TMB]
MSDQQPLLPTNHRDEEREHVKEELGTWGRYQETTSKVLEHPHLHKAVIALITIDACCVLADLIYTFLSEGCTPTEDGPHWLEILAHISLGITTFFLIEIPLSFFAFGPQFYNPFGPVPHAVLHLFDAIIIIVTFIFEVVLKGREKELAGLLIILRLWRLVKLVGGVAVGVSEVEESDAKDLAETREELKGVIVALSQAKEENNELRKRLAAHAAHDPPS